ncbi:MAG: S9 family peptidase [Ignavibacteria bacterium]|nr:MAG: S9 family peptidase [Ignavibacteria bacterium]
MIIEREILNFDETQLKMLKSAWGEEAIENSYVEKITYLSDGLKVKGYIAQPTTNGKFPSVIWCRGGYGNRGAIDTFTARGIFGQLASWGYVVFASQYRGNDGGEGRDELGGEDVNDILNLIPLAQQVDKADEKIWGIEGWSRGGMMTYLTLTKTDIFKAAIVTGGITDLQCNAAESPFMKRMYNFYAKEIPENKFGEFCSTRSIINFPDKLSDTPLLIIHGTDDERVSANDSIRLSQKLLELKKEFRLLILEKGDHFLKQHRHEVDENRKMWFNKYLK